LEAPKTKALVGKLAEYGVNHALIITENVDEKLYLASRNLHKTDVRDVHSADPVSLVGSEKVVITVDALKKFEEVLG
ncbi:MAG: 50S ribosomal protein L4, partial [Pseudomonadales bacterium]|nr:50S ribosomal protein L4 [Pseudomonadales bacterium]